MPYWYSNEGQQELSNYRALVCIFQNNGCNSAIYSLHCKSFPSSDDAYADMVFTFVFDEWIMVQMQQVTKNPQLLMMRIDPLVSSDMEELSVTV